MVGVGCVGQWIVWVDVLVGAIRRAAPGQPWSTDAFRLLEGKGSGSLGRVDLAGGEAAPHPVAGVHGVVALGIMGARR